MLYKEAVAVQIDLGRFTTAAKLQKEIAELYEAESDLTAAMEVSASQCYTTRSTIGSLGRVHHPMKGWSCHHRGHGGVSQSALHNP